MKNLKKNGGIKFLISIGIFSITFPCIIYYMSKYYIQGSINIEKSYALGFTIICSLIIISIILGIYNAYKNIQLEKENLELKKMILNLNKKIENNHYDNLEYQNGTRELILDIQSTEVG